MVKVPPYSIQAEEALIGSCLIGGLATVNEARGIVSAQDFYDDRRRRIWEAIVEMADQQMQIDLVTLKETLQDDIDNVGGTTYLLHLVNITPTAAHVKNYAEIVRKKNVARQKIRQCQEIMDALYNDEEPEEIISQGMVQDFKLIADSDKADIIHIKDVVLDVYGELEDRKEIDGIIGVPTGFIDLDRKLGGLRKGGLHILAARPSMGKTTLALNIAKHVATKEKNSVLFISLEMTNGQLVEKLLAEEAGIKSQLLQNTTLLTDKDWKDLARACNRLSESALYLDDSRYRASELAIKLRCFMAMQPVSLVVIDYIQIIVPERTTDRNTEVGEIARILQGLAKELNVPILALAQLNRAVDARQNKIPLLSDLRDSGTLEQEATTVMFLYRDDYYNPPPEPVDPSEVNLIIAKNRFGPLGRVDFQFFKAKSRFTLTAKGVEESLNSLFPANSPASMR